MKKRITSLISFTRSFRICRESTTRRLSKMDGYAWKIKAHLLYLGEEEEQKEDANEFPALVPGQTVRHLVHKHEPPVLCSENEIEILEEVDDIVAVRKPATVPVHPTGQYRNNSVVEILRQRLPEMNDKKEYFSSSCYLYTGSIETFLVCC